MARRVEQVWASVKDRRRMRSIRFAGAEHQSREINAAHVHHGEAGSYYGDGGRSVLYVNKHAGRSGTKVICDVIGEGGLNVFGEDFVYADYFLPEELAESPVLPVGNPKMNQESES